MGFIPNRPTGSDKQALFDQWVYDQVQSLQPRNSPTLRVARRDTKGIEYIADAGGQGGTSLIQCVVTQCFGEPDGDPVDYIGVTKFDFATNSLSGSQFLCAKQYSARQPASEVIDGQLIVYSNYNADSLPANSNDNVRLATYIDGTYQWQVVHNRYLPYGDPLPDGADLLTVSKLQNQVGMEASGETVQYIEVSPFRAWSYSPYLNGQTA